MLVMGPAGFFFDVDFENKGMGHLINDSMTQEDAARAMIKAEPQRLDTWLKGISAANGTSGVAAVKASLGL